MARIVPALITCFLLATMPVGAAAERASTTRAEAIDALHESGAIDDARRGLYLLYLLHAPERLPGEIRRLPTDSGSHCLTTMVLEALRSLRDAPEQIRDEARRLLGPPPPSVGHIDSAEGYPIRIFYETEEDLEMAEAVLEASEQGFAAQVELLGWTAPTTEEDGEPLARLDVYIHETPYGASGYCEPLAGNGLTSWTDALVRCAIDSRNDPAGLAETVQHELHHALQFSEDAIEFPAAYEMFCIHTISSLIEDNWEWMYFVPHFQDAPYLPIFWMTRMNPYYHYGTGLFAQFLDERYGAGDARLAVRFWQAARQDGDVEVIDWYAISDAPNDPDLFDVIRQYLRDEHDSTFEEALIEFAEWRLLLGENDDGAHFERGMFWSGAEPTMDISFDATELPVAEEPLSSPPMPSGTSYVQVLTDGLEGPERLKFTVDLADDTRWAVQAFGLRSPAEAVVESAEVVEHHAEIVFTAAGYDSVVFAVTNLGVGDLDPASADYRASEVSYDLELMRQPTVVAIEPSAATAGITGLAVTVTAEPLDGGAELSLGEGITVDDVTVLDGNTITAVIDIASTAPLGRRDVSVTNPGGDPGLLEGGFEVLAAPAPNLQSVEPREVEPGSTETLTVIGSGLLSGATAALGDDIEVLSVDIVNGERAFLTVEVAAGAAAGARDLTMTNPGGAASTLTDAVVVLGDEGGCNCGIARGDRRNVGAGLLLVVAAFLLMRRPRGSRLL